MALDGYGIVETLIVIVIISILILVVMSRYENTLREARKSALQAELVNIRQAILLFKITKKRYPNSLHELLTTNVMFPHSDPREVILPEDGIFKRKEREEIFKNKYLEPYSVDKENNILDPFGLPFLYNPDTGKVRSQKNGFESW